MSPAPSHLPLRVTSAEEFRTEAGQHVHRKELLHSLGSIRYCKAELEQGCALGILRIPQKSVQRPALLTFGFYLTDQQLTLIEDSGRLRESVSKLRAVMKDPAAPDQLLALLLEELTENDVLYLQHLEEQLAAIEDSLLQNTPDSAHEALLQLRKKLSEFHAYYEQLLEISDLFQSAAAAELIQDAAVWKNCYKRIDRLRRYVDLLREYTVQLWELVESRQTARQNQVMSFLTVVTTLFLPLTLLTGWYGMNFAHMPELHWRYSYPVVALIAAAIVIAEILYFKKKHML